jgi:hypothetical protein
LLVRILLEDNGSRERNVWLWQYFGWSTLSTVMRLWLHFQPRIFADTGKKLLSERAQRIFELRLFLADGLCF